jgi:hypothetical protein
MASAIDCARERGRGGTARSRRLIAAAAAGVALLRRVRLVALMPPLELPFRLAIDRGTGRAAA